MTHKKHWDFERNDYPNMITQLLSPHDFLYMYGRFAISGSN